MDAIRETSSDHIRNALWKICVAHPESKEIAMKELLIYEDQLLKASLREQDDYEINSDGEDQYYSDGEMDVGGDTRSENFEDGTEECECRYANTVIGNPWWEQRCAKYQKCRRCGL